MGGIWFCIYESKFSNLKLDTDFITSFTNLQHRGPDNSQLKFEQTIPLSSVRTEILRKTLKRSEIESFGNYTFLYGYHRLSINDTSYDGHQPFEWQEPRSSKRWSMCNGEIYNWKSLKDTYKLDNFESGNDCEVILHLYNYYLGARDTGSVSKDTGSVSKDTGSVSKDTGSVSKDTGIILNILSNLDGEYAFVITDNVVTYDHKKIVTFVARDPLGIKPLYYIKRNDNSLFLFVSELKGIPVKMLDEKNYTISEFPPGHYWTFKTKKFERFYSFEQLTSNYQFADTKPETVERLYTELENVLEIVTKKRLSLDVTFGVTLSGGIGSSILANLILQSVDDKSKIQFFTVGDLNSDDVYYSKVLVGHFSKMYNCELKHTVISPRVLNESVIAESIENILETNENDIIEYSKPFYILYDSIRKLNPEIRVLINGDGTNELFGTFSAELSTESTEHDQSHLNYIEIFTKLSKKTSRLDKLASAFGLELRLPYLDIYLVEFFLKISPVLKGRVNDFEKYILRKANEVSSFPLPREILYRK
jgi:asparagine synthase (glutamine-hydrolysing)